MPLLINLQTHTDNLSFGKLVKIIDGKVGTDNVEFNHLLFIP